jgi:hypothetical protein
MKASDRLTILIFYLGWLFAGVISFSIAFIISMLVDLFIFNEIFGDTIIVDGQTRITEDYMLPYAFIPWFGVIIGIMQYLLLRLRIPATWWWTLTTTIGWSLVFLGLGFYYRPVSNIHIPENAWYLLMGGIIVGIILGVSQWVILRIHLTGIFWWIPANILGFGVAGYIFGDITSMYEAIFAFTIPLLTTGVVLWQFVDVLPRD